MIVAYARVSTLDQIAGFEAQMRELKELGAEKIFSEQLSSVARMDQLEAAIDFVREGDTLVVTKLDRLARSVRHLWQIIERLKSKGAGLQIVNLGIDSSTATGKLMLTLLGGVAEFEREILLERQREGIARAKAEGKYRGRRPTAKAQVIEIRRLRESGMGASQIASGLGLSRASVYRCLAMADGLTV